MAKHYGLTLRLRDDAEAIAVYKEHHQHVWPEVLAELRSLGIERMHIFLLGRRLFQFLEANDAFDPARDLPRLNDNPRYAEWDRLMRTMQEKVPEAGDEAWWAPMDEVFDLSWPQFRAAS
jgi:L-rhamnose mutarotase